jgi:hypothetical protein
VLWPQLATIERERDEAVAKMESGARRAERAARDWQLERAATEVRRGSAGVWAGGHDWRTRQPLRASSMEPLRTAVGQRSADAENAREEMSRWLGPVA